MMTAPELLNLANGGSESAGTQRCFWCGAPASREHVRPAGFTNWAEVSDADSRFICDGCVRATDTSDIRLQPRLSSWRITRTSAERAGKSAEDAVRILDWLIVLPEPPFVLVVSVAGQKNLIYRAPVNWTREVATVQFETERVTFRPAEFAERLELCRKLVAATGKPALVNPPDGGFVARLATHFLNFEPLMVWCDVWNEPLSRLCAHVVLKKEICLERYPNERESETRTTAPAGAADDVGGSGVARKTRGSDGPGLFAE